LLGGLGLHKLGWLSVAWLSALVPMDDDLQAMVASGPLRFLSHADALFLDAVKIAVGSGSTVPGSSFGALPRSHQHC
jgi:hypothetical protein